jgi:hypothetical protein
MSRKSLVIGKLSSQCGDGSKDQMAGPRMRLWCSSLSYHQLCAVAKLVDKIILMWKYTKVKNFGLQIEPIVVKSSFWGLITIASKHTQPDFDLVIVVMRKNFKVKITQNDCSHVKKSVSMQNA